MFIIGIILGGAVVIFMLQSLAAVSVSFLAWNFDGSLALIVILAVVFGMIISWLLAIPDMFRLSNLKSHNKRLEDDLYAHKQKLSQVEADLSQAKAENTIIVK
jgi:lipopolysaccharide assembly protein A